jgi:hypothetical protein
MKKAKGGITWPVPCPQCGKGKICPLAKRGRTAQYKGFVLDVPTELEIPTCSTCGAEWIDPATATRVDAALEAALQTRLRTDALALLDRLVEHVTQREMEQILGLSAGYLSKVRTGTSTPSPMLVACLRLLSRDTERRLREVRSGAKRRRATAPKSTRKKNAAVG